jgi:hypothetical protein
MSDESASTALIIPAGFALSSNALTAGAVTDEDLAAMQRHVKLANQLSQCRYFTEEERTMSVTMDAGVTTSWDQTLPDAGATRDMIAILRQLFTDRERSSFASMAKLLRRLANQSTEEGRQVLSILSAFETARLGVQDSWDAQRGGMETSPERPLTVFRDWMYGEFLHSDADKAKRIEELDTEFRLYEWQFHWVAERLALIFVNFARVVRAALDALSPA